MPRVCVGQGTVGGIIERDKGRDEHTPRVLCREGIVVLLKDTGGLIAELCVLIEQRDRARHEQRRRDPLARYVGDRDKHPAVVKHAVVVQIAADVLCGQHIGEDIRGIAVHSRGLEQSSLDIVRDVQLRFMRVLFAGEGVDIIDIGVDLIRHRIEGMRHQRKLVIALDR